MDIIGNVLLWGFSGQPKQKLPAEMNETARGKKFCVKLGRYIKRSQGFCELKSKM